MSHITGAVLTSAQVVEVLHPGGRTSTAEFGRQLEESGIDFVVLRPAAQFDDPGRPGRRFDPSIAAATLARHTASVGVVVAAAPLRDHPYNLARRISSLDHISGGRAGWLVLPDAPAAPGGSVWSGASNPEVLADAVVIARKLWESWPDDTIVGDADTGLFADSSRIVRIDHVGAHSVSGPLNVPEPPQSKVPVFWDAGAGTGVAELADVVIGTGGGHTDQLVLTPSDVDSPQGPAAGAGGVVLSGNGSAAGVIEAAARLVEGAGAGRPGVTLRERLGLPEPQRVLQGALRSAFGPS